MKLNLNAPINSLGYGIASQNICEQLIASDHEVALHVIGQPQVPAAKQATLNKARALALVYDEGAPTIRIYHQDQLAERVGRGRFIGFPFFELRQFKLGEKHHMGRVDALCVASHWAKDVVEEQGIGVDTFVVPLGVDRTIFNEDSKAFRKEHDYTVFINVGKWEIRKGHDSLLRAFNKAFHPTDKVILRMMPTLPFPGMERHNAAWHQMYMTSRMGAYGKIDIRPRAETQQDVAKLFASSDCGVFPARAEGWNLDLLEAMSCGLTCIATNYSAHTEFVTSDNCRLIEINEYELADDHVWFHGDGEWAKLGEVQEDALVEHMRDVHRLKQTGALPRNDPGIETAKQFSWKNTVNHLMRAI
jgi:glycosyltransferase involved in cell wall biosynthesis